MDARSLGLFRAALGFAAAALAGTSLSAKEPEPQYWRKTSFALSFHEPRPGHDVPKEVHLHVSSDRGQSWSPYAESPPDQPRFVFKAPRDGEYWFTLRTKFASGRYLPTGRPVAEKKVVVDTAPPTLELEAREGEGGEVHLRWQVSDPNLAAETLRLEYKTTELESNWQPVALERPVTKDGQTEYVGETTIVPLIDGAGHSLIVRADVADKAQNHTAREQPLRLVRGRAALSTARETPEDSPPEMQPTFPRQAFAKPEPGSDRSYPALDSSHGPLGDREPLRGASDIAPLKRDRPPSFRDAPPAEHGPAIARPGPGELAPETPHPPIARRHDAATELIDTAPSNSVANDAPAPLDADVRPHLINKKRFELVYEIDSLGTAGIAEVELWCTRDRGHTWSSFGADDDCRSPMLVDVDGEGLYGFRVVAATTSGLRSHEPTDGEPPDVWVEVDLTAPQAALVSAEQGAGDDADKLVIVWEANDERLAARPIALRYRESLQAAWTTIASGLENTGRYAWRLDQRLPERVYLQLEVRDEAGNVGAAELPEAVSLRQVRPQSRIREVHPVGVLPAPSRRRMPR